MSMSHSRSSNVVCSRCCQVMDQGPGTGVDDRRQSQRLLKRKRTHSESIDTDNEVAEDIWLQFWISTMKRRVTRFSVAGIMEAVVAKLDVDDLLTTRSFGLLTDLLANPVSDFLKKGMKMKKLTMTSSEAEEFLEYSTNEYSTKVAKVIAIFFCMVDCVLLSFDPYKIFKIVLKIDQEIAVKRDVTIEEMLYFILLNDGVGDELQSLSAGHFHRCYADNKRGKPTKVVYIFSFSVRDTCSKPASTVQSSRFRDKIQERMPVLMDVVLDFKEPTTLTKGLGLIYLSGSNKSNFYFSMDGKTFVAMEIPTAHGGDESKLAEWERVQMLVDELKSRIKKDDKLDLLCIYPSGKATLFPDEIESCSPFKGGGDVVLYSSDAACVLSSPLDEEGEEGEDRLWEFRSASVEGKYKTSLSDEDIILQLQCDMYHGLVSVVTNQFKNVSANCYSSFVTVDKLVSYGLVMSLYPPHAILKLELDFSQKEFNYTLCAYATDPTTVATFIDTGLDFLIGNVSPPHKETVLAPKHMVTMNHGEYQLN